MATITNKTALFGYSAAEAERIDRRVKEDFEEKKARLGGGLAALRREITDLRAQLAQARQNPQPAAVKKRPAAPSAQPESPPPESPPLGADGAREKAQICEVLFEAHLKATQTALAAQKSVAAALEKKRAALLLQELKAGEIKRDLQNLIDYVALAAKDFRERK